MKYSGPIVDTDVHHNWASETELAAYLPARWRNLVAPGGGAGVSINPATGLNYPSSLPRDRAGTTPASGGPPGSDLETMRRQLLDGLGVTRVVLQFDTGLNAGVPNPELALALVRAANDWSIDRWLDSGDRRLYGAILTAPQTPELAAEEIRRVGRHRRMVEVLLTWNAHGRPFGHPIYHPIYQAAAELQLPVAIHIGMLGSAVDVAAGGKPGTRLEFYTEMGQAIQHHLLSFITGGVFEKYPTLKLLLLEVGVAWLPWLVWSLDRQEEALRRECSHVRRRPSDYIREHVRLSTQPLEMSENPRQLVDVLEALGGVQDLLCFSTDYPHWDADDPTYISRRLPETWLSKVFYENACSVFGWDSRDLMAEAGEETTT